MEFKHTPGPWRWEFNKQAKSVYLVGGKPRYDKTVMQFGRWGMSRATPLFNSQITGEQYNVMERICDKAEWTKPYPGFEHHSDWRMNVTHPDAMLIAAAPELLAIAQRVAALNENAGEMGAGMLVQLVTEARKAVKKATE